jgi:anti-sigma factor RsiW
MNCNDVRRLLEGYSDAELDLVRQLEVEAHLRVCPECALQARAMEARRGALRESIPRFAAPAQLRERVVSLLRAEGAPAPASAPRKYHSGWSFWNVGGLAASLLLALLIGYSWGASRSHVKSLLDEAISDHVRSLQGGHLLDVISSDQHTVKPWFIGKVDFSPPVVDLAEAGYPLAGGRLEHIDGRAAAALVFRRRLHSINLFIWPATNGPVSGHLGSGQGYGALGWTQGGLNFLAVSEIPAAELDRFVQEYRAKVN